MRQLIVHALTAPYWQQTPVDGAIRDTLGALLLALFCLIFWAVLLRQQAREDRRRKEEQEEALQRLRDSDREIESAMDRVNAINALIARQQAENRAMRN